MKFQIETISEQAAAEQYDVPDWVVVHYVVSLTEFDQFLIWEDEERAVWHCSHASNARVGKSFSERDYGQLVECLEDIDQRVQQIRVSQTRASIARLQAAKK